MTELERVALAVAMLTATVHQLYEFTQQLQREVQDLKDVFRGCACFGTDEQTEISS